MPPTLIGTRSAGGTSVLAYAFWSRGGADDSVAGEADVRIFTPADIVGVQA